MQEANYNLWNGHPITLNGLPEIREYVDRYIANLKKSYRPRNIKDENFDRIIRLIDDLDDAIPWFTDGEEAESLEKIPTKPAGPERPLLQYYPVSELDSLIESTPAPRKEIVRRKYLADIRIFQKELKLWGENHIQYRGTTPKLGRPKWYVSKKSTRQDIPNFDIFSKIPDFKWASLCHYLNERDNYAKLLREWRNASRNYDRLLPEYQRRHELHLWITECKKVQPDEAKILALQKKIVIRLRRELNTCFDQLKIIVERVQWQLLPEGPALYHEIELHLQNLRRRYRTKIYEEARLKQILLLNPAKCFIGKGEFDGYFVFLFDESDWAILECPWYGNALYTVDASNWMSLTKKSKAELLYDGTHTRRVIHDENGMWFLKLKQIIKTKFLKK
jgi:hypothetical protein